MSSDLDFFKAFIGSLKFTPKDTLLQLVKTNNYNASVYKFKMDSKNRVFLLSYNDNIIKSAQSGNILIFNCLNNPMYSLLFTNSFFNPKNFNESLNALDMYSDNIKQCLKYKEILNIQNKTLYTLKEADIKYIQNSLGDTYDNIVNDLLSNQFYLYNFIALFFGIKINYWIYRPGMDTNITFKKLEVCDYLFDKMKIDSSQLKSFNIFDYFYTENTKNYFYTFFMTLKIDDDLRNYFISCD